MPAPFFSVSESNWARTDDDPHALVLRDGISPPGPQALEVGIAQGEGGDLEDQVEQLVHGRPKFGTSAIFGIRRCTIHPRMNYRSAYDDHHRAARRLQA